MSTPDATALSQLISSLPAGVVAVEPATLENYRYDWSRDHGAGTPLAVVRPTDADQVQTVLRWATEHRIPVVPRGAGSGLSGGSSAVDGGIVLSMERMRAIEIDTATRVAVVEPGAFNAEVKAAAAQHGLWYPPDPSSYEICSIGGNIATNAGGLCCVKYGVTTDYVLGLDVVLADGTLITLGGKRIKDVAGLSLLKLFVGSEGTLGIDHPGDPPADPGPAAARHPGRRASRPWRPPPTPSWRSAATLRPSMMELMDNASINAVEDYRPMGLDRDAGAMLIAQSDAPGAACALTRSAAMEAACDAAGANEVFVTDDPDEGELFVAARRAAFPAIEARGSLLLEDVGVPVPLLPELLAGIAKIARAHDVEVPVVAHAGDGNTHPIIVFDPADEPAAPGLPSAFDEIMALAIALGGTITGEHGVGRAKKAALPDQLGPGRDGAHPSDQERPRPARHPQPRGIL